MHEVAYTIDASLRRRAILHWVWLENTDVYGYVGCLVIAVLGLVYAPPLRLLAALILGFALANFANLAYLVWVVGREQQVRVSLRLGEAEFDMRTPVSTSVLHWSAFTSISLTRRFVFLKTPTTAIYIYVPRAELSAEALSLLVDAARAAGVRVQGA